MALLSVLRFTLRGVFDDATVRNICGAFDLACKQLNDAGQRNVVHEVMIKRIIAAARRGERGVKLLQDAGLTGLRKPNHQIVGEGDSDERGAPQIASKHPEFWNPNRQLDKLGLKNGVPNQPYDHSNRPDNAHVGA